MKKIIPVVVALLLILIVVAVSFGAQIIEKYSYSSERKDLNEYFEIYDKNEVPVMLQNETLAERVYLANGICYWDIDTVHQYLNERFYANIEEGILLYATAVDVIRNNIGENTYTAGTGEESTVMTETYPISLIKDDKVYIALDYVKKFTNFSYELFTEPNHIQMNTQWGTVQVADINKATAVRVQGGIKSLILKDLAIGEKITVLEQMETWSKVKTADSIIGYVENKRLDNLREETQTPVTDYVEPEYTSISKEYTINMAWHVIAGKDGNATLSNVLKDTKSINTISPTWFSLTDDQGNFSSYAVQAYVDEAHQRGIEVWPAVDNFNNGKVDMKALLSSSVSRKNLIDGLMNETLQYGIDGINIDFEEISADTGEDYVQFLRELSIVCRKNGIVLSIDNYVPKEHTAHYNRKEQGTIADYVIIMGYDEHWGGGGIAGSVASIGFVEEGIRKTLEDVPAEKVINAIPFYTRVWETTDDTVTSQALGMQKTEEFLKNKGAEAVWDEETCQNYAQIQEGDTLYQVWVEDVKSIEVKLTIMKKYGIAGVAEWRLGLEKPEIWDIIQAYVISE